MPDAPIKHHYIDDDADEDEVKHSLESYEDDLREYEEQMTEFNKRLQREEIKKE